MGKGSGERQWLKALQPRAIIFGFSLGLFVLTCLHDYHLYTLNNQPGYSPWVGSAENEVATFFLVVASLGLLLSRWWSHLIAIVLGGKVFFSPGFLSLWVYANTEVGRLWSLVPGRIGFPSPWKRSLNIFCTLRSEPSSAFTRQLRCSGK